MSVRLLSSDNEEFVVRKEVAEQSVFIENMLLDGENDSAILLPNVIGKVLQKVIEWCDHHSPDQHGGKARTTEIDNDDWDQTFWQMDKDTLFDIINAANYLDIKGLVTAGCKAVANMIKGMSPMEIQKIFKIVNDFTPEEEAHIRRQNQWEEDR